MTGTEAKTSVENWVLDPSHSELVFKVKHLMISNVKGEFRSFQAQFEGEDFTRSTVKVVIDAASVFTNNNDRDNHLKSGDFFDVETYPTLVFESTAFTSVDDDDYELKGLLTIKDVTKEVTLKVEYGGKMVDPYGNEKIGFSVQGKINRKEWGLNWNAALETGGVMVSEEVKISAEVQFVKTSPEA